jgi:hypothetical protein
VRHPPPASLSAWRASGWCGSWPLPLATSFMLLGWRRCCVAWGSRSCSVAGP